MLCYGMLCYAITASHDGVGDDVGLCGGIADKKQYCDPPWVREYFDTYQYSYSTSSDASPLIQFHLLVPDSININTSGMVKNGIIFQPASDLEQSVKNGHFIFQPILCQWIHAIGTQLRGLINSGVTLYDVD